MSNHRRTWSAWLEKLTAVPEREIPALSEALSFAAPQGPRGFSCQDECRCSDAAERGAVMIHQALVEQHFAAASRMSGGKELLTRLQAALHDEPALAKLDTAKARLLARHGTIVSAVNSEVAHARGEFPEVWKIIREYCP